jgi:hypothetical protein
MSTVLGPKISITCCPLRIRILPVLKHQNEYIRTTFIIVGNEAFASLTLPICSLLNPFFYCNAF